MPHLSLLILSDCRVAPHARGRGPERHRGPHRPRPSRSVGVDSHLLSLSHRVGPVISYLAKIPSATQTNVTGLQWFKVRRARHTPAIAPAEPMFRSGRTAWIAKGERAQRRPCAAVALRRRPQPVGRQPPVREQGQGDLHDPQLHRRVRAVQCHLPRKTGGVLTRPSAATTSCATRSLRCTARRSTPAPRRVHSSSYFTAADRTHSSTCVHSDA